MALPPTFVKGVPKPAPPKAGGHYVPHAGGFQLIHAVGPGHWKPGPVTKPKGGGGGGRVKFAGPGVPLNSPALNPSKQLSGQSLYNAASALAGAQTKGPLAELANQIAQNNRQTSGAIRQTGGYLNSLGNFAKQGVVDEGKIGQQLNAQLGYIGGAEQQGLQGIGQNAQTMLSRYTPAPDASAMGSLTAELARQQGLAAQSQGAFKSAGALQGANYSGLAAQSLGTDALAGTQTLKGISQAGEVKNEPLNAKIADLRAQKGALIGTDIGKLRQQEIANKFTTQGLGLKQQGLQVAAAQDAARNALTARGQDITAAHNAATEALTASGQAITSARNAANAAYQQAKTSGKIPAGTKSFSAAQNGKLLGQINKSVGMIREAQASFGKPGGASRGQVRTKLAAATGYPNYVLDAAFELVGYGALSPRTAAYLHGIGLRGGGYKVGAGATGNAHGSLFGQPISI